MAREGDHHFYLDGAEATGESRVERHSALPEGSGQMPDPRPDPVELARDRAAVWRVAYAQGLVDGLDTTRPEYMAWLRTKIAEADESG